MTRDVPELRALVPHAGPMVLLDRVVEVDDDNLCAALAIRRDSLFCANGAVGSWVGVEYMAQAVAAHAGYLSWCAGRPVRIGFLLGTRKYEAAVPAFAVGMTLNVRVHKALMGENGLGAFECRIEDARDGALLASATVTVFEPDNVDEFLQRSEAS